MSNFSILSSSNILQSPAYCIVNTVNCEGFMGKGLAYQFKAKYPENNKFYQEKCKNKECEIGKILFFKEREKIIANFPTKDKWREKSKYEYIELGLQNLTEQIQIYDINSIAIPPLGCGNGGLEYKKVKTIIEKYLKDTKAQVYLYEAFQPTNSKKPFEISQFKLSHFILIKIKESLNKFTKIRLQKTAFFMNIFNNDEYFKFDEYKFGPYAHCIEVLSRQIKEFQTYSKMDTHHIAKMIYEKLISTKIEAEIQKRFQAISWATQLVNQIPSDKELEILATLTYIVKNHPLLNEKQIIDYFLTQWPKYNNKRFSENEILSGIDKLVDLKIIQKNLLGFEQQSLHEK